VQPIVDQLAKAGCHVIRLADLSLSDLFGVLASVDCLVVFISFASVDSGWVRAETHAMLKRQNEMGDGKIIPARLDRVPRESVSEFLLPLRGADFVESHDLGMASLLAALGVDQESPSDEVQPPPGITLLEMLNTDNVALHGPPGLRRALASPMHSTEARANPKHVDVVRRGGNAIADWRKTNPHERLDLPNTMLVRVDLSLADLSNADLSGANLSEANLLRAELFGADLRGADLSGAYMAEARLAHADLKGAILRRTQLNGADVNNADLALTDLRHANLMGANLNASRLEGADLSGSNLLGASIQNTIIEGAILTGCRVHGVSVWDLKGTPIDQSNLIITGLNDPDITIDNIQLAQFIYLLLYNPHIRDVIDTVTSKVVLILGRFSSERKPILDAIRDRLRHENLVPVLFDFEKPAAKDVTGTVETLARMARFIIVDLTDPSSVPHELATIVPFLRTTPVLPMRVAGSSGYGMFGDLLAYPWVLKTLEYENRESLVAALPALIAPVDEMAESLRRRPSTSDAP
jgi:uncharacterized protein YjbI with pentapeptide repeats